jgi:hypothetical protein
MDRITHKTREARVSNEGRNNESTARKGVTHADEQRIATSFRARNL